MFRLSARSLSMRATMCLRRWNRIKEDAMFEVTPAATEQIAAYFKDIEVRPIRIFLNEGG
jgi:hypothetical protein